MIRCLLSALLFNAASATISDCDKASIFRPTDLALTPDPPIRGQSVTMTVRFDNPGLEVTNGTVKTSIWVNYIPVSPTEEALCINTACPIPSGPVDRSTSSVWPDSVQGTIVTKSQWFSDEGYSLLCVQTKVAVV